MFDKCEQRGEIAYSIEQADRFGMQADLLPGDDLEEFVEGAVAAGERDKAVRQVGHHSFALVHTIYLVQLSQSLVRNFAAEEAARDDANCFSAPGQHSIRYDAHQPDTGPAVYQPQPARHHLPPKSLSRPLIFRSAAEI